MHLIDGRRPPGTSRDFFLTIKRESPTDTLCCKSHGRRSEIFPRPSCRNLHIAGVPTTLPINILGEWDPLVSSLLPQRRPISLSSSFSCLPPLILALPSKQFAVCRKSLCCGHRPSMRVGRGMAPIATGRRTVLHPSVLLLLPVDGYPVLCLKVARGGNLCADRWASESFLPRACEIFGWPYAHLFWESFWLCFFF